MEKTHIHNIYGSIITCLVIIGIAASLYFYFEGFNTGNDLGMITGKTIGIDEGYRDGLVKGKQVGYNSGYKEGADDGERLGKKVGLNSGTDCLSQCNTGTGIVNSCYDPSCVRKCWKKEFYS